MACPENRLTSQSGKRGSENRIACQCKENGSNDINLDRHNNQLKSINDGASYASCWTLSVTSRRSSIPTGNVEAYGRKSKQRKETNWLHRQHQEEHKAEQHIIYHSGNDDQDLCKRYVREARTGDRPK